METKSYRLSSDQSLQDAIIAMSEGVIGAATVLITLMNRSFDNFLLMLELDSTNVYGSDIWILFKDCCGSSYENLENLFKNKWSGEITTEEILNYIHPNGKGRGDPIPEKYFVNNSNL